MTSNLLYSKEECPLCHHCFMAGYDSNNIRKCPSCKQKFRSGTKIDHGPNCGICLNRHHGANNLYHKDKCPALMSDGRFITYYNSSNELTEAIRKLNGINSSNKFRNFMQKHADLFMDAERRHTIKENTCAPCIACSEGWHDLQMKHDSNWANASV